jgi:two-component system chemotaxis response regulator CheY
MKTCLIVDDSRVIRKVSRHIVEQFGFEVTEAEDGKVALERCVDAMPDLILLDWNMPVMSGMQFIIALRAMDKGDGPRVVFCTTEYDAGHIRDAIAAGANEYVMKPFDQETLKLKLELVGAI